MTISSALFCEGCGAELEPATRFCGRCGQAVPSWGLERFRFAGVLGRGGTATVYLAFDAVLGHDVAVKVLHEPGEERRLGQAVGVSDPHLVQVLDHGRDGQQSFVVLEHVEGSSLRQLLGHEVRLRPEQVVGVVSGALLGLAALHRAGLVHGDVTPGNIVVDQSGTSRLTDLDTGGPSGLTPAYASPEAALGETLDARSDLYAMGSVLYECLSGQPPFGRQPDEVVLHRQVHGVAAPVAGLPAGLAGDP